MPHRWPLLALGIALSFAAISHARPPYQKALAEFYGPFLAKQLNDCRTCHVPLKPGEKEDPEDRPHNAFGARLKAVKKELAEAGKKTDIITRLETIAGEDSDGDTVANLLEILSGHYPGEADHRPSATELEQARKSEIAFRKRVYYRWEPFAKVQRSATPQAANAGWVRNPIDAFIAAEHEQRGLKPRPEAPRHVLVRRVYLDLVGLPPTPEEVERVQSDKSQDWYEKLVDELLARPQYGERWGRHWMDVWRYADWAGYGMEIRESREHIWQWRDWIVEALNQDKGYDRMVMEMLAGDELAPDDPATLRATGFLVRNWYKFSRNTWLEHTVEHTSKAFLGFTMNCARCHDHFFDTDVTQEDYYRFRAFFEPHDVRIDRVPGEPDVKKLGLPRVFDARPAEPTYLFVRGNDQDPDKSKPILPGVPRALGGPALRIDPVALPVAAYNPDKRPFVIKETLAANEAAIAKAQTALLSATRNAAAALAGSMVDSPLGRAARFAVSRKPFDGFTLAQLEWQVAQARQDTFRKVLHAEQLEDEGKNGSAEWKTAATEATLAQRALAVLEAKRNLLAAPGAKPQAAALAKAEADAKLPPSPAYTKRAAAVYPKESSGRRLALARWIADRDNPLTARVAVNHIWLRHFGQPLVPTVFDFGRNGQPPSHPALLDWLAAEFMDPSPAPPLKGGEKGGWSMKRLHRLIVTSSTYRMDSLNDAGNVAIDRENRYLWRANVRRMEAELVRDGVLHLSGQLDTTFGGAEIPHGQALSSKRRSIYLQHAAEKQAEFLSIFDAANVTECYQRSESVVPQQALALANSTLVVAQARLLARRLTPLAGETPARDETFIRLAFAQVLGRPPTPQEQTECAQFLVQQTSLLARKNLTPFAGAAAPVPPSPLPHQRARENLVQVLFNHNDFVTIR
jgi:hypothetical protein